MPLVCYDTRKVPYTLLPALMDLITCFDAASQKQEAYRLKNLLLLLGRQGRIQGEYLDRPNL